jgi:large subunit ribosomal protein L18
MDSSQLHRNFVRKKRSLRVRKKLRGDQLKPRLCVVKSSRHLYVQIIDDESGITMASTSTLSKDFRHTENNKKNKTSARQLGLKIAEVALEKNVRSVVFDRGRFKYHGILASVADGAREGGLQF